MDSVDINDKEIVIKVRNPRKSAQCPHCGKSSSVVHQRKKRRVVHDTYNDRHVVLLICVRRFSCRKCCNPFTENHIPGVGRGRFTSHFKYRVLQDAKDKSLESAARRYKVSSPTVMSFLKENEGNVPWPKGELRLAIDGHSFSGRKMKTTVGCSLNRTLLAVLPDEYKDTLVKYLDSLPSATKERITEVCIDMSGGYRAAIEETLPNARIVVDHFHVVKELLRKMDEVRKILQPRVARGDRRINRFLLLKNKENLTEKERLQLKKVFKAYEKFSALEGSWWVKEKVREMYRCTNVKEAERKLDNIILQLEQYEVSVLAEARRMLVKWKPCILNFFVNRTTNAFAEGCNNKIKVTKRMSYGFRNFENYVLKITLAFMPFVFVGNLPH